MNIMLRKIISGSLLIVVFVSPAVSAEASPPPITESMLDSFKVRTSYQNSAPVSVPPLTIPTVVEVPLPVDVQEALVYEVSTDTFIESYVASTKKEAVNFSARIIEAYQPNASLLTGYELFDNNPSTFLDVFRGTSSIDGTVVLEISASRPVSLSSFTLEYARSSQLPVSVQLLRGAAISDSSLLLAQRQYPDVRVLNFPEQLGSIWTLIVVPREPLRITEIKPSNIPTLTDTNNLRFLAQPGATYEVYLYPEEDSIYENPAVLRQGGNLYSTSGLLLPPLQLSMNYLFKPVDTDSDGVIDRLDNCPNDYNPDQTSSRANGRGDVCDDFDNDGVVNSYDNCENIPNYSQRDVDADGLGDDCDLEESRLTERYPFLPWVGVATAFLVIMFLFVSVARQSVPPKESDNEDESKS